ALSDRAAGPQATGVRDVTHLIWPESAFPFFLTREPDALAQIAALLPEGTVLITGAVRPPDSVPDPRVPRAYNSVYVIDHSGTLLAFTDNVLLFRFGNSLPPQKFLNPLAPMQPTNLRGGFTPAPRRHILTAPRAPSFLPLICYEVIFPGETVPPGERPGWLLN